MSIYSATKKNPWIGFPDPILMNGRPSVHKYTEGKYVWITKFLLGL